MGAGDAAHKTSDATTATIERAIERHKSRKGALLPILSEIQNELGWVPESAMVRIAEALDIPASKVYGTVTFYTLYATRPKGKNVIRVCESAPCHVEGASEIVDALERALGVKMGETTPDGLFSLEFTSCIGVCGVAPAIMINDHVYGNLTPDTVRQILATYRATA
ncbi:MAG: NADH-quinone oxidoreductase subunit NuoE [Firmicutes bacterium]|nr:NADH-quinone oxidoreductase subunit NuoE [Bacillota bacterium]